MVTKDEKYQKPGKFHHSLPALSTVPTESKRQTSRSEEGEASRHRCTRNSHSIYSIDKWRRRREEVRPGRGTSKGQFVCRTHVFVSFYMYCRAIQCDSVCIQYVSICISMCFYVYPMCFLAFIIPPIDLTQENNSKPMSHVYFGHHRVFLRFGHRKRVKMYLNVRTFHWASWYINPIIMYGGYLRGVGVFCLFISKHFWTRFASGAIVWSVPLAFLRIFFSNYT